MFTSTDINREAVLFKTATLTDEKIFYIGNTSFFNLSFCSYFPSCQQAVDFLQAKKILTDLDSLPELIIIDIPLNNLELIAFKFWLKSYQYHKIPIIYSQTALNSNDIKQLFKNKLVDDVVNLEEHYRKLPYKIKFIQKLNNKNPQVLGKQSKQINYHLTEPYKFCIRKKILDIALSTSVIIFCLPIFMLIAIAIKCESKGPVFYYSNRAGKGYRIFKFFKFRTMLLDADKQIKELANLNQYKNNDKFPTFFKLENDPRVTKVGAFLRKTSLDELPQLFNVLKGDMSIVGNRPLPLYEASTLTTNEWAERFMAPAGITGLWQISKRGKAEMSNEERISLDINYARNRSLKGDLKILIQTPSSLIQKGNV